MENHINQDMQEQISKHNAISHTAEAGKLVPYEFNEEERDAAIKSFLQSCPDKSEVFKALATDYFVSEWADESMRRFMHEFDPKSLASYMKNENTISSGFTAGETPGDRATSVNEISGDTRSISPPHWQTSPQSTPDPEEPDMNSCLPSTPMDNGDIFYKSESCFTAPGNLSSNTAPSSVTSPPGTMKNPIDLTGEGEMWRSRTPDSRRFPTRKIFGRSEALGKKSLSTSGGSLEKGRYHPYGRLSRQISIRSAQASHANDKGAPCSIASTSSQISGVVRAGLCLPGRGGKEHFAPDTDGSADSSESEDSDSSRLTSSSLAARPYSPILPSIETDYDPLTPDQILRYKTPPPQAYLWDERDMYDIHASETGDQSDDDFRMQTPSDVAYHAPPGSRRGGWRGSSECREVYEMLVVGEFVGGVEDEEEEEEDGMFVC